MKGLEALDKLRIQTLGKYKPRDQSGGDWTRDGCGVEGRHCNLTQPLGWTRQFSLGGLLTLIWIRIRTDKLMSSCPHQQVARSFRHPGFTPRLVTGANEPE